MAAQRPGDELWVSGWDPSHGEATIAKREAGPEGVKLYCSWFCPFAQRGWIAFEEKGVDYKYVEINPYEVDGTEPGGYTKKSHPLSKKAEMYPDFIEASPRGLVPAASTATDRVWESLPLVEYVDEKFEGPAMMPDTAQKRALARIWSDHVTSRMQRHFYTLLMEQSPTAERRAQLDKAFFEECSTFAAAMAPIEEGPFFFGSQFSMIDIALAPFYQRFVWVGEHYLDLQFPAGEADLDGRFKRLDQWWQAVLERPSVKATLVCRPRLISSYSHYFRGVATSDWAKSIQPGLKDSKPSNQAPSATQQETS